jgi:CRISPR-associated protein Csb1
MFDELKYANQLLMQAELRPVQGDIFQPTGFKDIGAATYQLPESKGSTRMILVESAQSMANRLENQIVGLDGSLLEEFEGLSYIMVQLEMNGKMSGQTSSLVEAHRLNSPFIISDQDFQKAFKEEADYEKGKHLNWEKIARTLFKYDVNCLLHGIFLSNLEDGRIKVPRALSSFIEARGVREAVNGGVKLNPLDPTGKVRAENFDKDVYGHVPYQRVEYTAETITAYFNLDVDLIRSYRLPPEATELLILLALYKVRAFLDHSIRLRSRCHFALVNRLEVTEPEKYEVPQINRLLQDLQNSIRKCKALFNDPPDTKIITRVVLKKDDKNIEAAEQEENADLLDTDDGPKGKPATRNKKRK